MDEADGPPSTPPTWTTQKANMWFVVGGIDLNIASCPPDDEGLRRKSLAIALAWILHYQGPLTNAILGPDLHKAVEAALLSTGITEEEIAAEDEAWTLARADGPTASQGGPITTEDIEADGQAAAEHRASQPPATTTTTTTTTNDGRTPAAGDPDATPNAIQEKGQTDAAATVDATGGEAEAEAGVGQAETEEETFDGSPVEELDSTAVVDEVEVEGHSDSDQGPTEGEPTEEGAASPRESTVEETSGNNGGAVGSPVSSAISSALSSPKLTPEPEQTTRLETTPPTVATTQEATPGSSQSDQTSEESSRPRQESSAHASSSRKSPVESSRTTRAAEAATTITADITAKRPTSDPNAAADSSAAGSFPPSTWPKRLKERTAGNDRARRLIAYAIARQPDHSDLKGEAVESIAQVAELPQTIPGDIVKILDKLSGVELGPADELFAPMPESSSLGDTLVKHFRRDKSLASTAYLSSVAMMVNAVDMRRVHVSLEQELSLDRPPADTSIARFLETNKGSVQAAGRAKSSWILDFVAWQICAGDQAHRPFDPKVAKPARDQYVRMDAHGKKLCLLVDAFGLGILGVIALQRWKSKLRDTPIGVLASLLSLTLERLPSFAYVVEGVWQLILGPATRGEALYIPDDVLAAVRRPGEATETLESQLALLADALLGADRPTTVTVWGGQPSQPGTAGELLLALRDQLAPEDVPAPYRLRDEDEDGDGNEGGNEADRVRVNLTPPPPSLFSGAFASGGRPDPLKRRQVAAGLLVVEANERRKRSRHN